jgi:sulfur-carrier protein
MVRVTFAANILKHVRADSIIVEAEFVGSALARAFEQFPGLKGYVLDDQGQVRHHVTVFINNQTISDRRAMQDRLVDGDEVYVFQALSGG